MAELWLTHAIQSDDLYDWNPTNLAVHWPWHPPTLYLHAWKQSPVTHMFTNYIMILHAENELELVD